MDWVFVGGISLVIGWLTWLVVRLTIRYKVGHRTLHITLAGFPVRRIKYSDIARLSQSTHRLSLFNTERWNNTSHASTRCLVVHRRSGIFKRVLITPKHRESFREELALAIRQATGDAEFDAVQESDTERTFRETSSSRSRRR